jgi:hypothetical protein
VAHQLAIPRYSRVQRLGHPAIAPVLVVLLLTSVAALPLAGARIRGRWERTVVELVPWLAELRPASSQPTVVFDLYFVPNAKGEPVPVDPMDTSQQILQDIWNGMPAVWVGMTYDVRRVGWFAPTVETVRVERRGPFNPYKREDAWSTANLDASVAAFEAILRDPAKRNRPDLADAFARGDRVIGRRLWWGIAWNYATLAALAALGATIVAQVSWWRHWLARRRIRKNRCGRCGYDLEGVAPVESAVKCSECGARWGVEGAAWGVDSQRAVLPALRA